MGLQRIKSIKTLVSAQKVCRKMRDFIKYVPPFVNQGCLVISINDKRFFGSATKILSSKSLTSSSNHDGYEKSAFEILRNSADIVGSSNGKYPAKKTNRMTPMDHVSAM